MINKIYVKTKEYIKNNLKDIIILVMIVLFFMIELPFVVYRPGGVIDLSKRIETENSYSSNGKIQMTYVTMMKGKIPFVLLSYIMPNWDLEKTSKITYDGDSMSQTLKKDKISYESSIDNAIISAYTLAGQEIDITNYHNNVIYITDEATTTLNDFDEIISINDIKLKSLSEIQQLINSYNENDIVKIKALRNKKEIDATAKIYDVDGKLKIGIGITTTYDLKTNPDINVKMKKSESGPSGGLMTALGIYNAITKEDITKGKNIAGTGTITETGTVGEIGGIKYKILGAVKKKVDIFLCPEENYKEAMKTLNKTKSNMKIIKVKSLQEAINKLNNM